MRAPSGKVPAARGLPLLRPVPRAACRRRGSGCLHEQPHQRRDARLRHQPGALRHRRHHGHPGRARRRGRLGHPRAKHPESGRCLRHRPGHARERARHARDAWKPSRTSTRAPSTPASAAASRAPASATAPSIAATSKIRVLPGGRLEVLTGYTEMGQGVFTAMLQAVCEETGLPIEIMTARWDKELGLKCGETWASRATTLSCAAAQRAAVQLAPRTLKTSTLEQLVGREYSGEYVCNFTTRPGTPEASDQSHHAHDVQLRHAGGHSRRRRAARARGCGARRRPRHQPARCAPSRWRAASTWAWVTRCPRISPAPARGRIRWRCANAAS